MQRVIAVITQRNIDRIALPVRAVERIIGTIRPGFRVVQACDHKTPIPYRESNS